MIRKPLPIDIYGRCVTFVYGTVPEINRLLARECPRDFVPLRPSCKGHWHCYPYNGHEADYLCVTKGGRRDFRLAVIAHEAFHFVGHALAMAGLPYDPDNDEAYTYYLQWIILSCAHRMP